MKKFKKILALALSLAMVLGMSVTTFATPGKNKTEAQIEGIEAEMKDGQNTISVKAYQIISYDEKGSYKEVLTGTIDKDGENLTPTAANALALAKRKSDLGEPVTFNPNVNGVYTASVTDGLTAGTWLVLVEGSSKYFYNPILISVEQSPDGLVYGTLNLTTDSWLDTDGTTVLYAKKSEPTITKTAEKANENDTEVVGTQYGDILKFTVTADIPGYITGNQEIKYSIKDTLTGLALVNEQGYLPTATVGGATDNTLTAKVNAAIVANAKEFEVKDLGDDFLIQNAGKQIVITYFAKVTSEAKINVDRLNNTATLTYGTNDSTEPHVKEVETKHYTFGIGTTVDGKYETTEINKTGEFVKVNSDGSVEYVEKEGLVETKNGAELLSGAEFQLHIGSESGELFTDAKGNTTFTTGTDGRLEINGLDSDVDFVAVR